MSIRRRLRSTGFAPERRYPEPPGFGIKSEGQQACPSLRFPRKGHPFSFKLPTDRASDSWAGPACVTACRPQGDDEPAGFAPFPAGHAGGSSPRSTPLPDAVESENENAVIGCHSDLVWKVDCWTSGRGPGVLPDRARVREWRSRATARKLPPSRAAGRMLRGSLIVIGLPATLNLLEILAAITSEVARSTAGLIV